MRCIMHAVWPNDTLVRRACRYIITNATPAVTLSVVYPSFDSSEGLARNRISQALKTFLTANCSTIEQPLVGYNVNT